MSLGNCDKLSLSFAFCSPILANMNLSRGVVTFTASDRIAHEIEVRASIVYKAVGEAHAKRQVHLCDAKIVAERELQHLLAAAEEYRTGYNATR